MSLSFTVADVMPAGKEDVYKAWLDSEKHAKMTGTTSAIASAKVGDTFMAHDGYISGKNKALVPYSKIVQSWRTMEFSGDEEDSVIEVTFEDTDGGTVVTLTHSNLPPHGRQYEEGWKAYYFKPMKAFFGE